MLSAHRLRGGPSVGGEGGVVRGVAHGVARIGDVLASHVSADVYARLPPAEPHPARPPMRGADEQCSNRRTS